MSSSSDQQFPKGYAIGRSFRDTLYGRVRYGQHLQTTTPVVIKEYNKQCVLKQVTLSGCPVAENAKDEIRLHAALSRFRHPHIVQIYDVQEDAEKLYTIMEYCGKGEFFNYLQSDRFSEDVAKHYFKQLLEGVYFLHSKNVCHRDLSLENLLMDDQQVLKICDFGVAIECVKGSMLSNNDPARRAGKLRYMAPEVFASQPYDPRKADVWSCGVIFFVMLVGGEF